MEKRKLVMCGVLSLLALLSVITAFAAEATKLKRSQVKVTTSGTVATCTYPRNAAMDLGFTSALFLTMAQMIASIGSGCFCCRKGPSPSTTNWIIALISFVVSWVTFVIAFLLLLSGSVLNYRRTEENKVETGVDPCVIVKSGVFSIASVLSLVTIALGIVYYLCLTSSKQNVVAATTTGTTGREGGGIAMGQPQIPERVEDPVFVHEDTYMRRQFT